MQTLAECKHWNDLQKILYTKVISNGTRLDLELPKCREHGMKMQSGANFGS